MTAAYERVNSKMSKYIRKAKESKEKQLKFIELDDTLGDLETTLVKHDNNILDSQKSRKVEANKGLNKMMYPSVNVSETKEEYKTHLELLQRDLNKNPKLQHPEKFKQKVEEMK